MMIPGSKCVPLPFSSSHWVVTVTDGAWQMGELDKAIGSAGTQVRLDERQLVALIWCNGILYVGQCTKDMSKLMLPELAIF